MRTLPNRNRLPILAKANPNPNPSTNEDALTIWVYDEIGFDPWSGTGIGAADFVQAVQGAKGRPIHLRINSPGGDVFDARAMVTALRSHDAPVTAQVDGLAASAASYLAVAAGRVDMAVGSFLMVHRAWAMCIGNAADMEHLAATLTKIDDTIAADYARRSGMSVEDAFALMSAETWIGADEAVALKLADGVVEGVEASALWEPEDLRNAPEAYRNAAAAVRAAADQAAVANVAEVIALARAGDVAAKEHEHRKRVAQAIALR